LDATVLIIRGAAVNVSMTLGRIEEASASIETASKSQEAYWRKLQAETLKTLKSANTLSASLNEIVRNADRSINAELLPAATATLTESTVSIRETRLAAVDAVGGIKVPLADIHSLLADPAITDALKAIAESAGNVEGMTASAERSAGYIEGYLSPKKMTFWARLLSLLIPKLSIDLR
jgi:hypothetical protein